MLQVYRQHLKEVQQNWVYEGILPEIVVVNCMNFLIDSNHREYDDSLEVKFKQISLTNKKEKISNASTKEEQLACVPCGKTFSGPESKAQHLESEKHKKKLLENQNDEVSKIRPSLKGKEQQTSDDLFCVICQKPFTGLQSKQEHLKSEKHLKKVSQTAQGSTQKLECKLCDKIFSGKESLEEHLKSKKHLNRKEAQEDF